MALWALLVPTPGPHLHSPRGADSPAVGDRPGGHLNLMKSDLSRGGGASRGQRRMLGAGVPCPRGFPARRASGTWNPGLWEPRGQRLQGTEGTSSPGRFPCSPRPCLCPCGRSRTPTSMRCVGTPTARGGGCPHLHPLPQVSSSPRLLGKPLPLLGLKCRTGPRPRVFMGGTRPREG